MQLKTVMLLQAACTASCCFVLITLATTVGIFRTLDLVPVDGGCRVAGGGSAGTLPGARVAALGFPLVPPDAGAFLFN